MNITLLANRDVASNLALNHLLPELHTQHTLRVHLSSEVGAGQSLPAELTTLKFFEQTLFNELLFPTLEGKATAGELLSFAHLGQFTESPVSILNKINSEDGLASLATGEPDLVLSIRYGNILKDAAIATPGLGVINLHSGLLPDYRGVMATFRALLNGDSVVGTTLQYITDPGIDTGAIIGTTTMAVQRDRSYLWHVLQLYPDACASLVKCVNTLASGRSLAVQPQAPGGNYYSFPTEAELRNFGQRGWTLYDAEEITSFAQRYLGDTL